MPKGKPATVYNFEFARTFLTLKRAPASRHEKCLELLGEQATLEERLRCVRGMLDTLVNGPIQTTAEPRPAKPARQSKAPNIAALLHEQSRLEERLQNVHSMLYVLVNTPVPTYAPPIPTKPAPHGMALGGTVIPLTRG